MSKRNKDDSTYDAPQKSVAKLAVLFVGLALSAISFACAVLPVLALFIPSFNLGSENAPLVEIAKILNLIAVASAVVGSILSVIGANQKTGVARLAFSFAVIGFLVGLAMLFVCLFASAVFG